MPKLSLPVRLALLVAGTMLPLIIFAVGLVLHYYMQDRDEARRVVRILERQGQDARIEVERI